MFSDLESKPYPISAAPLCYRARFLLNAVFHGRPSATKANATQQQFRSEPRLPQLFLYHRRAIFTVPSSISLHSYAYDYPIKRSARHWKGLRTNTTAVFLSIKTRSLCIKPDPKNFVVVPLDHLTCSSLLHPLPVCHDAIYSRFSSFRWSVRQLP